MKSWWLFGVFTVLYLVSSSAHSAVNHETAVQAAKAGPGATVSTGSTLQSIAFSLFEGVGGIGAVITFLRNVTKSLPAGQSKDLALQAVDVAGINLYSVRYKKSVNPAERKALKGAAEALDQQNMAGLFPIDPSIDGATTS